MGFMDKLNEVVDTAKQAYDESTPGVTKYESTAPAPGQRFEYDVLELREKLLSGAGSAPSQKLRNLLNDRARQGWEFKFLVAAEVEGVVGGRAGWMAILEREVQR